MRGSPKDKVRGHVSQVFFEPKITEVREKVPRQKYSTNIIQIRLNGIILVPIYDLISALSLAEVI